MTISRLLVANRGEVAVRVIRAADALGIATVGVYSEDDAASMHVRRVGEARPLAGKGPRAYLNADAIVAIARETGSDAVHPGYGLLSEDAGFARRCIDAGLAFVGPRPEVLELLGDKGRARQLAEDAGVPVLAGTSRATSLDEARAFMEGPGRREAIVMKAIAGGGGRGMRVVRDAGELPEAYARCRSEARAAFGNGGVYVERFLSEARHIEVQAVGDRTGAVAHFRERDCSLQRRHQKVVEVAPAFGLDDRLRVRVIDAALTLARKAGVDNLVTFEFLTDGGPGSDGFYFIEANPRLQVEHTITEAIAGVDLVQLQLQLAGGSTLAGLARDEPPVPRGCAIELRINAERIGEDGAVRPATGTVTAFAPPPGPGIRVDTHAYAGLAVGAAFDPLLAKLIVFEETGDPRGLAERAAAALAAFRIEGVETNIPLLRAMLQHPDFDLTQTRTNFVETHLPELVRATAASTEAGAALAGARVDPNDPLAVLVYGKSAPAGALRRPDVELEVGEADVVVVRAPIQGTVIELDVAEGDVVHAGQRLLVMEAMKMEHVITAASAGRVIDVSVAIGDTVYEDAPLLSIEPADVAASDAAAADEIETGAVRPDLAEVIERHATTLDEARPDAVARRRKTGQRTARENVDDLCDEGSFVEYGPLVIAAQRRRRTVEELIAQTPADGMIAGIGAVNRALFGEEASRCVVMSYDYTVLAGTQGQQNHRKKDRLFELAEEWRAPLVLFAEGGGGRPGDTDGLGVAGLDCLAFWEFGRLSGLVPLVGIVSGRCFAGNAALLGCCDVVIATRDANIGMGGPAMVEGGGLGVFRPEEIGPVGVQARNGVIDVLADDEEAAVAAAKRYLSYFQGRLTDWQCADQRLLRAAIPENRRRVYDVRRVIETLADAGSVLELRRQFGAGMVTALIRIEGNALGLIANNPMHLAGAIDSDGADKAARFMQLCDAFDLPLLFLCDTPGIMVGPEVEKTALVRHASRMFVTGANLSVPFGTIVLRKGYGLGAQAMAGGSFKAGRFTIAWPTGEFGGMGLEGAVKLGYRNELAAIDDAAERKAAFDEMVERMYRHGKALNTASHFEIDDVIDPADSRRWITSTLFGSPSWRERRGKKRTNIDTW